MWCIYLFIFFLSNSGWNIHVLCWIAMSVKEIYTSLNSIKSIMQNQHLWLCILWILHTYNILNGIVMTTIFKIEFLGGEFLLVRAVLSIRLHAKRAVLGIIIVMVKNQWNLIGQIWRELLGAMFMSNFREKTPGSERCEWP